MRAKRKLPIVLIMTLMTLVGLVGGMPAASAAPGDFATVTVVHAIPDTVVDVEVDDDVVVDDFEPQGVDGPVVLTSGLHTIDVTSSDGLTDVVSEEVDLTGGGNYTVVAHLDAAGDPALTLFENNYEPVDSGMSEVVVRHVAEAPTVDVLDAADDSVMASELDNAGEQSAFVTAGTPTIEVVATGTTEPALVDAEVDLAEQTKNFVYVIGSEPDETLALVVVPWDGFTGDAVFQGTLNGDSEVPPVESDGAGLATFRIEEEGTSEIAYSIFVYGLTDIAGGHIHIGVTGANGGVAVDLLGDAVTTPVTQDGLLVEGTIMPEDIVELPDQGFDGSFAELVRLFRVDPSGLYVNLHTSANASGEIRGQILPLDVPDESPFTDTSESVHATNIDLIGAAGITLGCNPPTNDEYCPESSITRGQMAAFLRRAFNLPASSADAFTDDDTSEFEGDIDAIAEFGITAGCNPPDNDQYCPDDAITRGQMAAFLKRAFGLAASDADQFTDDDESVFEGDIDAIFEAGITQGCNPPTNDRYCPDDEVTRAQMASFLARALGWGF